MDRQEIQGFVSALDEDSLADLMQAVSRRVLVPRWVVKSEMGDVTDEQWAAFLDFCEGVKWIGDKCCEIEEVWDLFMDETGGDSDDDDDGE